MSGLYASDGSWNVTVVTGSTRAGRYAANGSLNVKESSGGTPIGLNHPSGALNVTLADATKKGRYAPDGSMYVKTTPYSNSIQKVTTVSGSLGAGSMVVDFSDSTLSYYTIILEDF